MSKQIRAAFKKAKHILPVRKYIVHQGSSQSTINQLHNLEKKLLKHMDHLICPDSCAKEHGDLITAAH